MSEQNTAAIPPTPIELPAKRKRGRPRKDGIPVKKPTPQPPIESVEIKSKEISNGGGNMMGKIVSGVIDGVFDAGYFLTVKIGNNGTPLRGVVFQPGRCAPVTGANDVAPHMPLLNQTNGGVAVDQPSEFEFESNPPVQNLRMVEQDEVMQVYEVSTPSVGVKAGTNIDGDSFEHQSYLELLQNSIGTSSQSVIPKAVESDHDEDRLICNQIKTQELHHTIEVSKPSDIELNNPVLQLHEIPVISQTPSQSVGEENSKNQSNEIIDNEAAKSSNFANTELKSSILDLESQDLQLHQSPNVEKQNLETNKMIYNASRNPNLDLFGENQLLEFIQEPMDFMMERPSSQNNAQQNFDLEPGANEVRDNKEIIDAANKTQEGSDDTPYKLELAVKDSAPGRLE